MYVDLANITHLITPDAPVSAFQRALDTPTPPPVDWATFWNVGHGTQREIEAEESETEFITSIYPANLGMGAIPGIVGPVTAEQQAVYDLGAARGSSVSNAYGSFSGGDVQNILDTLNTEITDKTTAVGTSKYLTWGLLGVGGVFLAMALFGGGRR